MEREFSKDNEDFIRAAESVNKKLRQKGVKIGSLVEKCEELDGNYDGIIHISDLEYVFNKFLGSGVVTRRELNLVGRLLGLSADGKVQYNKLFDALDNEKLQISPERWYTGEEKDDQWAAKRGSVGEFLQRAACPAEIKNFKRLIGCLEEFERRSGMKCIQKEDGFIIPLGPDLKASINFFMS